MIIQWTHEQSGRDVIYTWAQWYTCRWSFGNADLENKHLIWLQLSSVLRPGKGNSTEGQIDAKWQVDYWAWSIMGESKDESPLKQTYVLDMDVLFLSPLPVP